MVEIKKHEIEKAQKDIAHLLFDEPWYCDWEGCFTKAIEITNLPQIIIKKVSKKGFIRGILEK